MFIWYDNSVTVVFGGYQVHHGCSHITIHITMYCYQYTIPTLLSHAIGMGLLLLLFLAQYQKLTLKNLWLCHVSMILRVLCVWQQFVCAVGIVIIFVIVTAAIFTLVWVMLVITSQRWVLWYFCHSSCLIVFILTSFWQVHWNQRSDLVSTGTTMTILHVLYHEFFGFIFTEFLLLRIYEIVLLLLWRECYQNKNRLSEHCSDCLF